MSALAHFGAPIAPHDLWAAWNGEPGILLALLLTAYGYARGLMTLWVQVGIGRGVTRWQVSWFVLGMLSLVVALVSPLDALSSALFSAHMVQHMLLLYVAPLLLVLGAPPHLWIWALPAAWRRPVTQWWQRSWGHRLWQGLQHPFSIWALFALVLWIWHAPLLYQAAVVDPFIHLLEHVSFFGVALLFCELLVNIQRRRKAGYGLILLILFTTAMHSGLLGALLTFAATPLYPVYGLGTAQWGLSLLADQQLAGVIMWVPVGFFYLGAMLLLIARWLQELERPATPSQTSFAVRNQRERMP
ncbi:MAG: cytochrome c oxidase assembly protein [Caldilineaceae bacterium]|nr:cytochrome c oxidase assembly protein [Caldilineaceae bacterium]